MDFKLIADMKPKGDQPKAIEKLVECTKKHKLNTLLGVTGSGKSLTPDELVLLYDENGMQIVTPIGEFIDKRLESQKISDNGETEILPVSNKKCYTLSINPKSKQVEKKEILSFIRHHAPKILVLLVSCPGTQNTQSFLCNRHEHCTNQ